MRMLLRIVLLLIPFLLFSHHSVQAALSVKFGPEHFLWREFFPNGSQALEESGFRGALQLHWEQEQAKGFLFGYEGKLYLGRVHYDGLTLEPNPRPISTDTAYSGIQNEEILIFRQPLKDPSTLDWIATLGWDHWSRNINPDNTNQLEQYDIFYLKFGPRYSLQSGKGPWIGGGGKFPLMTFENAHIDSLNLIDSNNNLFRADQNPILHPGKQLWFYINIGYRFDTRWEVSAYYDSYRFSESPKETITSNGFPKGTVYQPESFMDLIGLQAIYYFP